MPILLATSLLTSASVSAADRTSADVAKQIDQLILDELSAEKTPAAPASADEDFLRRISFDIAGTIPSAREVTLFGLDPDPDKRIKAIDRLLQSDDYAESWARYWRDVIMVRATNQRARVANQPFIDFMRESLKENRGWDEITRDMITASGEVVENGETLLIFAQEGSPEDIAGEVSRIFLGIQMQCANCHDHPWDRWNREQFHELAAFFPRIGLRREAGDPRTYRVVSVDGGNDRQSRIEQFRKNLPNIFRFADRNRDGKLTKSETQRGPLSRQFDNFVRLADKNGDGALTLTELKEMPQPQQNQPGRGRAEHFMPDLNNPGDPGKKTDPRFFVTRATPKSGLDDLERRDLLANYITSTRNEWFAKAFVNRMWAEMTGEGFYMPIDDMGPDRSATYPEVLDLLASEFRSHDFDIQWLMKTIASTATYQREIRPQDESGQTPPFAAATPTRLRGDQLYNAITKVLGGEQAQSRRPVRGGGNGQSMMGRRTNARDGFAALFGFDPSTPQADITGNVPQALFMMNSPLLNSQINSRGFTRLAGLLRKYPDDEDAIPELYLMVLSREPSEKEMTIAKKYITRVGNRGEAFEDLMWTLLNSSEFLSKR